MKHCSQRYAVAAALTAGVWYSLCTLAVVFARDLWLKLHAQWMHLSDLDLIAPKIMVTTQNFLSGLAQSMLYAYVLVLIFATIAHCLKGYFGDDCGGGSCGPKGGSGYNSGFKQ